MITRETILIDYLNWIIDIISKDTRIRPDYYSDLIDILFNTDFRWTLPLDENRAIDGIELRNRFADQTNQSSDLINAAIDKPCSVLEMIVALALRGEEHVMANMDDKNRTAQWFWMMLDNLGLVEFDDDHFDDGSVILILNTFMDRKYNRDGKGSMFFFKGTTRDMRKVEIWYQLMWYFSEILGME